MNLNKIVLVSGLVVSGIAVSSRFTPAIATNFVIDGNTYNITSKVLGTTSSLIIGGTFNDNGFASLNSQILSTLEQQPWWGNPTLAYDAANIVKMSLPVPGDAFPWAGPNFAYASDSDSPFFSEYSYGIGTDNSITGSVSKGDATGTDNAFAVGSIVSTVPEPLNILGATTGLVLFGTVSTALKRRKLSK